MKEITLEKVVYPEVSSEGNFGQESGLGACGLHARFNDQPIAIPLERVFSEFGITIADAASPNITKLYKRFQLWLIPHAVGLIRREGHHEVTAVGIDVEYLHDDETCSTVSLLPSAQYIEHGNFHAQIGIAGEVQRSEATDALAQTVKSWFGLTFGLRSKIDLSLNLSAKVMTPFIAAIGKGGSYAYWRFEKKDVPLFGRDIEVWSILALSKWQEELRFRARFYFEARVFLITRRIESDWVQIICQLAPTLHKNQAG